jgi:hypothetical protein
VQSNARLVEEADAAKEEQHDEVSESDDVDSDGSVDFISRDAQRAVAECCAAAEIWLRACKCAESDARTSLIRRAEEVLRKRDLIELGEPDEPDSSPRDMRAHRSYLKREFVKLFSRWNEKAQTVALTDLVCPDEGEVELFNRGRDRVLDKLLRSNSPPSLHRVDQLLQQVQPLPASFLASLEDWSQVTFDTMMASLAVAKDSSISTKRDASDVCDSDEQPRSKVARH